MRILKPTDDAPASERRLAAWMLNMEHAAVAFDDAARPRPAPHEPFPVVEVPPVTKAGLPVLVHHRPRVGVVFYTADAGFRVDEFVSRLAALLQGTTDHLVKAPAAMNATPSTVLRLRGRVSPRTVVTGPHAFHEKPVGAAAARQAYPSRLLIWPPAGQVRAPPHVSYRAAFTWAFLPIEAALRIAGIEEREANAMVASVAYDAAGICRLEDAADVYRVEPRDFGVGTAPEFLTAPMPRKDLPEEVLGTVDPGTQWIAPLTLMGANVIGGILPAVFGFGGVRGGLPPRGFAFVGADAPPSPIPRVMGALGSSRLPLLDAGLGAPLGALLVDPASGTLTYIGNYENLNLPLNPGWKLLPTAKWRESDVAKRGKGRLQCCSCDAPVGGDAVLLGSPRAPTSSQLHDVWFRQAHRPGAELLNKKKHGATSLLLCIYCWNALNAKQCLGGEHIRADVRRVVVPLTQSEVCAGCPGYQRLPHLLAGRVRPVDQVPGAFILRGKATELMLTGQCLGQFPSLTNPRVAALGLTTISDLRIAQAPGNWAA
ncbi:MAG: hypothetical protein WC700_10135 [Gemmatimonadaceae bacterium]|jgi:hypothetical protein